MLENLNGWEIIVLALLGLFIFGPERLPKVIGDGLRMIRNLRDMARNATNDLSREMGTDVRLEDLHPKTFIRKHLLSEEDERELRRPFDDMYRDVQNVTNDVRTAHQQGDLGFPASGRSAGERLAGAPTPASAAADAPSADRAAAERVPGGRMSDWIPAERTSPDAPRHADNGTASAPEHEPRHYDSDAT